MLELRLPLPETTGFGELRALGVDGGNRLCIPDESPWPISDRAALCDEMGEDRWPSSDCTGRVVTVRWRLGRNVASSSLSDSPSSGDSDEVSLAAEERGKADDVRVGGLRGVDMRGWDATV